MQAVSGLSYPHPPPGMIHLFIILLQEEMTNALATMRVDYEQITMKPVSKSANKLLDKRRKKAKATSPTTTQTQLWTVNTM